MIVGIDASNLRNGGGITHLVEILRAAKPEEMHFSQIIIWGSLETLRHLEERPWLEKRFEPMLERGRIQRVIWQCFLVSRRARELGCQVLFSPGGLVVGNFYPAVTMSRNMLPFEWGELVRYGISARTFKLLVLRLVQSWSFRRVAGLMFLTTYARDTVMKVIGSTKAMTAVVPHGVDHGLVTNQHTKQPISQFTRERPCRLLYVSSVDVYKHQWYVVEATGILRAAGFPVTLELVGHAYPPALRRLRQAMRRIDPEGESIKYVGALPRSELRAHYSAADVLIFASSCENLPNILLEGMAARLPIACAQCGPMPEVLGETGLFFDPESPHAIAETIKLPSNSSEMRTHLASTAFIRSRNYSWSRCANETFTFLNAVWRYANNRAQP